MNAKQIVECWDDEDHEKHLIEHAGLLNECHGNAIAIVGGQFGSEGKGAIAEYLAPCVTTAVRTGAVNAGHTVIYNNIEHVMRAVPCCWINEGAKLVKGISSIINLPILLAEIEKIHAILPIKKRLFIDPKAHVTTQDQIDREMQTQLASRISSTSARAGLGISMTLIDKIARSPACRMAKDVPELQEYLADTVQLINDDLDDNQIVLLEGTQGIWLSPDHGPFPYTTSRDTTAASLFASVGVNPAPFQTEVIMVLRAYPIRVGGPSGMFNSDSEEISWDEVRKRSGATIDITEKTSVTKTVRRVATFSWEGLQRACMINRPTELALTFADHIDASVYEKTVLTDKVYDFIEKIEQVSGISVGLVKTGPKTTIDFNDYRRNMLRRM